MTAVNFIGHGSPFQIADEKVMIADDPSLLNNGTRLPLFIAASCDVGRFSDPTRSSLGEHLLLRIGGGAIGVISSTDLAYSGQNALLNGVIYPRKGRVFVWLTDDARRLPVQIRLRMQFPIGTVTLRLQKEEHS